MRRTRFRETYFSLNVFFVLFCYAKGVERIKLNDQCVHYFVHYEKYKITYWNDDTII